MESYNQSFWLPDLRSTTYNQLCVFEGCNSNPCPMIKERLQLTHDLLFVGLVVSDDGFPNAFFLIHTGDIMKLSTRRFDIGRIRWWEDIFCNNMDGTYPIAFRNSYPRTW